MGDSFIKTLSARFVVFEPDDVVEAFKMLCTSVKSADLDEGSTGITTVKLPRAARWSVRGNICQPTPTIQASLRPQPLEPFMLHIWCAFATRAQLLEDLKAAPDFALHKFEQLESGRLHHGLEGIVPHMSSSSVSGEWQITAVQIEPPRGANWNNLIR